MVFLLRLSVLKLIIGGIILRVFLRYISRNMLEKKGRLVLLIFSIMLSTALLIVSLGLVQVVINSYKEPIKNMQDGRDISIYSNTADPFFSLDDFSHSGLKNVEGTLYTTGIINKDDKISYANFSGRMSYDKNIVEGSEDGKTSTQMELQLLNVARSSIGELRQDFEDYLKSRRLHQWTHDDERFQPMQDFTKTHNHLSDYEPFFQQWSAEEMANIGLTLCFQVDTMMNKYMEGLEKTFVTQGGIKERMHAARTGYRKQQDERLAELEKAVPALQQQLAQAQAEAAKWKAKYEDLKQRALCAYQKQQEEIDRLKELVGEKCL